MLVLSDTNGFRVDFYQLCEWVLQAGSGENGSVRPAGTWRTYNGKAKIKFYV